jgi:hypothetical protein
MSRKLTDKNSQRTTAAQMKRIRQALRLPVGAFSVLIGISSESLRAREFCRCRWSDNPLREHRRKIESELARMERDIAAVRALLSEAATPAEAVASAPTPSPALTHPMEAATA